jgi:hypothetical protein
MLEDSSEDEWYRPTPSSPRHSDPRQGSSQQAPRPEDTGNSSDDGSGDYTKFYRHFGM